MSLILIKKRVGVSAGNKETLALETPALILRLDKYELYTSPGKVVRNALI